MLQKKKVFYKEEGLEVKLEEANFSTNTTDIVLNNINSFGISDSILIYEKMLGKEIKILGAILQQTPLIFLYLDENIKSPRDFKNKRLMLDTNAKDNALVKALIEKYSLEEDDIKYMPSSYDVKDLVNGNADILISYITNEPYLLKEKGINYEYIQPKDYGLSFYGDILYTSEENFKKNPKRVEGFYKASIKGWEYAFENIDETISLIQEKYNPQNLSKERLLYEAQMLKILSEIEKGNFGKIELDRIDHIISTYFILENKFSIDDINNINKLSIVNNDNNELNLSSIEKSYLKQKKELTYCTQNNYYPYTFYSDKRYSGISIDFINEIQKRLGINIVPIKTKTWPECYNLIKNDKIDIGALILKEPNNFDFLEPTKEYLKAHFVLATKINEPYIGTIYDVENKVVAINKSEKNVKKLIETKYPHLRLKYVKNKKEAFRLILKGEVYGYIGPADTVSYYIQEEYPFEIKIMNRLDGSIHYGSLAIKKGNDILLSIMNKTINNIGEKKIREIKNSWIRVKQESGVEYSVLWKVSIIFLIFLVAFIYRQYVLRKTNLKLERSVKDELEKSEQKDRIISQQAKLASMGEMLNNIAHQWRQPLNVINSNVAVIDATLMKKNIIDDDLEKNLIEIESQTKYMSETIESFRTFFSPQKSKQDFLLSEAVDDVLRIVKYDYEKNGIRIKVFRQKDTNVKGYLGEYIQIIISILNNSKDAFSINEIKKPEISIYIDEMVIIDDNAGGIDEDIIDRVFEPYFTTKHKYKGTGTGLYMAKMIVEHSMNGSLTVQKIKNGTRFKIII